MMTARDVLDRDIQLFLGVAERTASVDPERTVLGIVGRLERLRSALRGAAVEADDATFARLRAADDPTFAPVVQALNL